MNSQQDNGPGPEFNDPYAELDAQPAPQPQPQPAPPQSQPSGPQFQHTAPQGPMPPPHPQQPMPPHHGPAGQYPGQPYPGQQYGPPMQPHPQQYGPPPTHAYMPGRKRPAWKTVTGVILLVWAGLAVLGRIASAVTRSALDVPAQNDAAYMLGTIIGAAITIVIPAALGIMLLRSKS